MVRAARLLLVGEFGTEDRRMLIVAAIVSL